MFILPKSRMAKEKILKEEQLEKQLLEDLIKRRTRELFREDVFKIAESLARIKL